LLLKQHISTKTKSTRQGKQGVSSKHLFGQFLSSFSEGTADRTGPMPVQGSNRTLHALGVLISFLMYPMVDILNVAASRNL